MFGHHKPAHLLHAILSYAREREREREIVLPELYPIKQIDVCIQAYTVDEPKIRQRPIGLLHQRVPYASDTGFDANPSRGNGKWKRT